MKKEHSAIPLFIDGELSVRRMRVNSDDRALLLNWLADPNGVTYSDDQTLMDKWRAAK